MLVDGQATDSIAVTDRALHYGDGLFETIAIRAGKPQLWQAHMARLQQGCARLGIPMPDQATLVREAEQLCAGQSQAVLKILISRGSGGRGYRAPSAPCPRRVLLRYPWPAQTDWWQHGAHLIHCQTPLGCNPALAGIKHLNRLEQVLGRNEWQDEDIHEGLMCDRDGHVIEGTMSNLFALRDGQWHTPDLTGCGVAGVMRQSILAMCQQQGKACQVRPIRDSELAQMDELLICNSLIGLVPVRSLAGQSYPITQGQQLQQAMLSWLEQH